MRVLRRDTSWRGENSDVKNRRKNGRETGERGRSRLHGARGGFFRVVRAFFVNRRAPQRRRCQYFADLGARFCVPDFRARAVVVEKIPVKIECPRCAMSVEAHEKACSFCGAPLPKNRAALEPIIENPHHELNSCANGSCARGCCLVNLIFSLSLALLMLLGAFSGDADADFARSWAAFFGVSASLSWLAIRKTSP